MRTEPGTWLRRNKAEEHSKGAVSAFFISSNGRESTPERAKISCNYIMTDGFIKLGLHGTGGVQMDAGAL
jgi:hypothetical protein